MSSNDVTKEKLFIVSSKVSHFAFHIKIFCSAAITDRQIYLVGSGTQIVYFVLASNLWSHYRIITLLNFSHGINYYFLALCDCHFLNLDQELLFVTAQFELCINNMKGKHLLTFVILIWLYALIMLPLSHFRVNTNSIVAWMLRNSLLKTKLKRDSNPHPPSSKQILNHFVYELSGYVFKSLCSHSSFCMASKSNNVQCEPHSIVQS